MAFASLTCTPVSGITTFSSCTNPTATSVKVVFGATPQNTTQLTISNIRNYDISSTSINFTAYFYNSLNYAMETTPLQSLTYTPAAISSFSLNNNDQIALY